MAAPSPGVSGSRAAFWRCSFGGRDPVLAVGFLAGLRGGSWGRAVPCWACPGRPGAAPGTFSRLERRVCLPSSGLGCVLAPRSAAGSRGKQEINHTRMGSPPAGVVKSPGAASRGWLDMEQGWGTGTREQGWGNRDWRTGIGGKGWGTGIGEQGWRNRDWGTGMGSRGCPAWLTLAVSQVPFQRIKAGE